MGTGCGLFGAGFCGPLSWWFGDGAVDNVRQDLQDGQAIPRGAQLRESSNVHAVGADELRLGVSAGEEAG